MPKTSVGGVSASTLPVRPLGLSLGVCKPSYMSSSPPGTAAIDEPEFIYHRQSQCTREVIFGPPTVAYRSNVDVGNDICVQEWRAAQVIYHPVMPDCGSLTTGKRQRPMLQLSNTGTQLSHLPLPLDHQRAARMQDHWMEDQLSISSLSHEVPWDSPRSSPATTHLSGKIWTDFQQQPWQMPGDVMVSRRDGRSAGVVQPWSTEGISWRLSSTLASQCLRFHNLQIQPHF